MINRVVIVGRLTKDPDLRYTGSNIPVVSFTVAVNRGFGKDQEADYLPCVAWRATAENVNKFVRKGSLVGVDGRIQTRNYEAQDGSKRYITEIVCDNVRFLDTKSSSSDSYREDNSFPGMNQTQDEYANFEQKRQDDPFASSKKIEIDDDDLPF